MLHLTRRKILLGIYVFLGAALAIVSLTHAANLVFAREQPSLAAKTGWKGHEVFARLAQAELSATAGQGPISDPILMGVKESLLSNPLARRGIRIQALHASISGNDSLAQDLMALGHKLSRRDLKTQYWLILEQAKRSSLADTFVHIDAALSVRTDARDKLFPLLNENLNDPKLREIITKQIAGDRVWSIPFMDFAISNSLRPDDVAQLMTNVGGPSAGPNLLPQKKALLDRYARLGQVRSGHDFAVLQMGADKNILSDISIKDETISTDFAPFTWESVPHDFVDLVLQGDGAARLSVGSGKPSNVLTRYLSLRSANYRFGFESSVPEGAVATPAQWVLQCVTGNTPTVISEIEVNATRNRRQSIGFRIDQGCDGFRIDLVVEGAPGGNVSELAIRNLSLAPA